MVVARAEVERVDTLRYSWHTLQQQVCEMTSRLVEMEQQFRRQLIDDVTTFTSDCSCFCDDYYTVIDVCTVLSIAVVFAVVLLSLLFHL